MGGEGGVGGVLEPEPEVKADLDHEEGMGVSIKMGLKGWNLWAL